MTTALRTTGGRKYKELPALSQLLPVDARELLVEAAFSLPLSRRVTAINLATVKVRAMYPSFFKEDI